MKRIIVVAAAIAALSGCDKSKDASASQAGELGRGTFTYVCGTGADAQCNDNSDLALVDPATNFPPIALGATFSSSFKVNDAQDPSAVMSAVPDMLDSETVPKYLIAKKVGWVALLGMESAGGTRVSDLIHAKVEPLDHLEVAQSAPTGGGGADFKGKVTAPGIDVTITGSTPSTPVTQMFRVVPMTKDRKLLAGALPCQWTTSNEAVARITTDAGQNIITVELKPGDATLKAALGGLTVDVKVKVGS
ncbi:MAG: hypothetical protein HY898_36240 [Deltaproteobacteria bacterium]|nr:hypothetical protein [Deltaproteobacteria bacterium]